jgi:hypothetical protein
MISVMCQEVFSEGVRSVDFREIMTVPDGAVFLCSSTSTASAVLGTQVNDSK